MPILPSRPACCVDRCQDNPTAQSHSDSIADCREPSTMNWCSLSRPSNTALYSTPVSHRPPAQAECQDLPHTKRAEMAPSIRRRSPTANEPGIANPQNIKVLLLEIHFVVLNARIQN